MHVKCVPKKIICSEKDYERNNYWIIYCKIMENVETNSRKDAEHLNFKIGIKTFDSE